jgi:hypothetical protein
LFLFYQEKRKIKKTACAAEKKSNAAQRLGISVLLYQEKRK